MCVTQINQIRFYKRVNRSNIKFFQINQSDKNQSTHSLEVVMTFQFIF